MTKQYIYRIFSPYILIFLFHIFIAKAHGIYLDTNYILSASVSYDNIQKASPVLYGDFNNGLIGENFSAHLNLILGNLDGVYDINSTYKTKTLFNAYGAYKNGISTFYLGYTPLIGSENYLNGFQMKKNSYFGIKLLNDIKKNAVVPDGKSSPYYVTSNSFLNNSYPFSASYMASFMYNALQIGINYIPNINNTTTTNKTTKDFTNKQAADLVLLYYNESSSLGYGTRAGMRYYFKGSVTDSNSKITGSNDVSFGGDLDYLGFRYRIGYLQGYNYFDNASKIQYSALENSLSYSILNYIFGIYHMKSNVDISRFNYKTSILEFNFNYSVGQYITLKSAFFQENLAGTKNYGLVFGIELEI